jgi:hypothetical protein
MGDVAEAGVDGDANGNGVDDDDGDIDDVVDTNDVVDSDDGNGPVNNLGPGDASIPLARKNGNCGSINRLSVSIRSDRNYTPTSDKQ